MNINFGVAANYNLETDIMEKGIEEKLTEEVYLPMLDAYEETRVSSNHFFVGRTAEILNEEQPEVIKKVSRLETKGSVEIGSHTYGHSILPLIPLEDTKRQIQYGKRIDEDIFSTEPSGFYPPEWCVDPTLFPILEEEGYEWLMLLDSNIVGVYDQGVEETFFPHKIKGASDTDLEAVSVYGGASDLKIRNNIFSLLEGDINPKECKENIISSFESDFEQEESQEAEPLMLLYLDIEAPYFVRDTREAIEGFKRLLDELSSDTRMKPTTISEYLEENHPETYVNPKSAATYKPIDIWKKGVEKLDIILEGIREELTKVDDAEEKEYIWKEILLAEGSDARIASTENRLKGITIDGREVYGNFERIIDAYDHALKAKEELREFNSN